MTQPRKRPSRGRPAPRRGRGRAVLRAVLFLLLAGVLVGAGALAWLWPRCSGGACPSVLALREHQPPQATRVLDRRGRLLAHLAPERRVVVPLRRIPARVSGAFLAVEDKRFYRHRGVDYRRVAGAAWRDLRTLSFDEGFSTLTMQLARNVFPDHLSRAKTLRRKLWEVVLARKIERAFTKDEILEMYLNQIYLGEGLHGVEAAAEGYFGRSAEELTLAQAATLAALPKAPSYYSPRRNPLAAVRRRNLVLEQMVRAGVVERAQAEEAKEEPLGLAPPPEASGTAPYFVAAVRRELRERFGPEAETRGLRVHTTLDPELQAAAERELVRQVEAVEAGRFGRFRGPSCAGGKGRGKECLQGLAIAMEARTGDVLALVGGRDFRLSQFDRATQARRQAGSVFKPFVYAAAVEAGIPVTTRLAGPGAEAPAGVYRPRDHVADSLTIDMREGLRLSSNLAAVALGERVGANPVVETARRMGITTPMRAYPSLFLGAADVIPLDLVASYSAFATQGTAVRPRLIRRVDDAQGNTVWEAQTSGRRALPAAAAFVTTSLLRDVVDRGTGSGVRAALPYEVPVAGKTGTTNEAADVWFVGATPDLVAGVWLGFDRPKRILAGASGGELAAPVWGRIAAAYYRRHAPPSPWAPPAGVVRVRIDRMTGMPATPLCPPENVAEEWFVVGTEPTEPCPEHPDEPADDPGGWLERWLGRGRQEEPAPPAGEPPSETEL